MIVYYIRHGYPSYSPDCLTKRGHYEATNVANYLKDKGIEKVFSSSSGRAHETAEHFANLVNLPITSYDWAREETSAKYILYNNKTWLFWNTPFSPTIHKYQNDEEWFKNDEFKDTKIHEGVCYINECLDEWLLSINVKRDSKSNTFKSVGKNPETVAFFAHGGMGVLFTSCLANRNILEFMYSHRELDTCGIAIFQIDFDKPNGCKLMYYNLIAYDGDEARKYPLTI